MNFVQMRTAGDALDRAEFRSFGFDGQHQTTDDRPTIHDHRASTAVAVRATFLGTGEIEIVSQDFEQRLPSFAQELDSIAVDR